AGNIATSSGISAITISAVGTVVTSNGQSSFVIGAPPVVTQSGQALDFIVSGPGLDSSIAEQEVRLIGSGGKIRPGTLRVEYRIKDLEGRSPLRFTVDIASGSNGGSVSLFIVHGSDTAFSAGVITIIPAKPLFTASSLVDAASFKGTGVAPGELI